MEKNEKDTIENLQGHSDTFSKITIDTQFSAMFLFFFSIEHNTKVRYFNKKLNGKKTNLENIRIPSAWILHYPVGTYTVNLSLQMHALAP